MTALYAVVGLALAALAAGLFLLHRLVAAVEAIACVLHALKVEVRHGPQEIRYSVAHTVTHRTEEPKEPWQGDAP